MSSVNKVVLVGNLGQAPEIRTMQNGDKVANLSIATTERWKDKSTGERKEKTEWHRVVMFGAVVDVIQKYTQKGSKVYIEGQLETRSWEQDGQKKYVTEVVLRPYKGELVLLDSKSSEPPSEGAVYSGGASASSDSSDDFQDEIPF